MARAIEELGKEKLGERAALIAYHWEHAGDVREAAKWHRRAAEWVGFDDSTETLRHLESARDLLDTLPESPENLAQRAAVRAQIMNHISRIGDPEDRASMLFREGRELAQRSGDVHVLSQVLNGFGVTRQFGGALEEALDPLLESIQRADETADIGLRVAVRFGLFLNYLWAGRLRECLSVAEQSLGLARGDLGLGADRIGFSPSLGFSGIRALVLSLMGHLRDGAAELDRVMEVALRSQQLMALSVTHGSQVLRCEVTGEASSALAHAREAVDYAERTGTPGTRIIAYVNLGRASILNSAWHDALEILEHALAIVRERRLGYPEGSVLAGLAAAHLGLGDSEQALALADEAITVCRQRGTRMWEFWALLNRARALREIRGLEAARDIEATLAEANAWLEVSTTSAEPQPGATAEAASAKVS